MPTSSVPSHVDPTHRMHPCLDWSFALNVPGVGRAGDCHTASALAYRDAVNAGDTLADTICGQPFGCKGRLIRVERVDVQSCVHLDSGQDEVHLVAHITYGCLPG